jgi:2-polyprenyl-3-methyl-5-hydroxy-6-metoxy-1,4-benzoquinol methylase
MSQITNGVRAVLSIPFIYSSFQVFMGAKKFNHRFAIEHIRPFSGMNILDVGCGPAEILTCLPDVNYWGFDISEPYISQAQKRFGIAGNFQCKQLQKADLTSLPKFDAVLALGLFHHLDNEDASEVMELASQALRPGGRLISVDPCIDPTQNIISSFLISKDRGQNVRDKLGYASLGSQVFPNRLVQVVHKTWIPYTHCFMECTKS